MILGIGCDICDIRRIEGLIETQQILITKIFEDQTNFLKTNEN